MPVLRVLGVDPGMNGAASIIDSDVTDGCNKLRDVIDIPTIGETSKREINVWEFHDWLMKWAPQHAYVELVHAMPSIPDATGKRRGMGAASAFRFGLALGMIRATIYACKIPLTLVAPTRWKPAFDLKGADKEASRQKVLRLFPSNAEWFTRKLDHNRADACLLALYGVKSQ